MKTKVQVSVTMDKKVYKGMEKLRKKKGVKMKRSVFVQFAVSEIIAEIETDIKNGLLKKIENWAGSLNKDLK